MTIQYEEYRIKDIRYWMQNTKSQIQDIELL